MQSISEREAHLENRLQAILLVYKNHDAAGIDMMAQIAIEALQGIDRFSDLLSQFGKDGTYGNTARIETIATERECSEISVNAQRFYEWGKSRGLNPGLEGEECVDSPEEYWNLALEVIEQSEISVVAQDRLTNIIQEAIIKPYLRSTKRESGCDWKQVAYKYGKLVRAIGHNINNEVSKAPMKIDREYIKAAAHHLWSIANYLDGTEKHAIKPEIEGEKT